MSCQSCLFHLTFNAKIEYGGGGEWGHASHGVRAGRPHYLLLTYTSSARSCAMTIVVNDIIRITTKMLLFGTDDVQNVFTFRVTGGALPDDTQIMQAVAAHMDIAYTILNPRINTALTYISVDGINVTQSVLLPDTPWPILVAGTNVTNLLPTQVAGCVFWPTTTPKVRTASFIGGFCEDQNGVAGEVGAALISDLNAFGVFMRGIVGANITAEKGSFNPLTSVFTVSGQPQTPARWRTQRRRRIGVGS